MVRSAALLSLILLAPSVTAAQRIDAPAVGTRIRATPVARTAPRWIGTVAGQWCDTLLVQTTSGDAIAVALSTLRLLEVSAGRRGNAPSGAGIGALLGSLAGATIISRSLRTDWFGTQFGMSLGVVTGLSGGALVGGVIGALWRTERWSAAPAWQVGLALPATGRGLGLAVRF